MKHEKKKNGGQSSEKDVSLKIISIPDKEWKDYRNNAPQDELLVLGIGMKLWLAKTRKSALLSSLGVLLAVAAGVAIMLLLHLIVGIAILAVGYLVFGGLLMRRHFIKTSLNQTKSKLNADNKKILDAEFKTSGGATFAEVITTLVLCTLCQPYSMFLAVFSAILPSVLNTKLVIPEGCGFEALEEAKAYYAEKSFLSETIGICLDYNRSSGGTVETTTLVDDYGNEINVEEQAYTNEDGEKIYKDDFGNEYVEK